MLTPSSQNLMTAVSLIKVYIMTSPEIESCDVIDGSYDGHDSEMVMIAKSARHETVWKCLTVWREPAQQGRAMQCYPRRNPSRVVCQGLTLFV
jgi:hypothetical protein